ncbi:unnamed protein product [Cuscuta epithymum]|uniref:Uncharacterized protein n=2 Tax=Cuscuta epithymum TaxID=186058 RepID=A0AAV0CJ60_9ASTE|nr:unnamed protein product [Cuscuta epithymum]
MALVAFQERHSSGTRSDKFAENKSNPKEKCNENLATIVESGVKIPVIDTSTKRSSRHHKKRKRSIDAICSLQSKNEPQQKQVLFLHSVSENQTDKSESTKACLLPRVEDGIGSFHDRSHKKRKVSSEKLQKCHVNDADRVKANLKVLGMQEYSFLANSIPPVHHHSGTAHNGKDRSDTLGDFELLVGDDYMKLLDLDNSVNEESYRLALQMPLSPELPEIKCESSARVSSNSNLLLDNNNNSLGEFSHMKGSLSPLEHFDVLDLEINSNKATHGTIGNSKKSLSPEISDHADTSSYINGNGIGCPKILQAHISNSVSEPMSTVDVLACANESSKVSSGSRDPPPCHGIPKCCVVFFDNDKVESISTVYSATKNFMNQCSTVSASNLYLRNILIFISGAQDLSAKEKASVFLSVLLHYISEMETSDLHNGWDRDSVLLIASFAHHICTVPSDVNNGMTFDESWNLYELLSLLEDFILHIEVLMFDNVCSDSKSSKVSRINLVVNANGVRFVNQEASINMSVAGCILLASLCAEVDHIGFICEASFNTLRMLKSDPSFVLTVLHIFAYVCGPKYFGIKQYCFVMAVVRSMVKFLEKLNPPDCSSCFTSLAEDLSKLWSGSNCLFSEGTSSVDGGTSSMDGVTSMLLDNLQNCIWSSTRQKVKVIHPSIDGEKNDTENMDISAAPRTADTPYCVTDDGNGCFLTDVLALVELVSCYMSWIWTVENIVRPVSKMMESCPLEHVPAAILVLLAQLGRYGVSANGYEDITIQNLRDWLSALLCGCDPKIVSHEIQFSIAIALLGVVPLNFAEIVERNAEIPGFESQYQATICLRKWFSLLSNEEQLSFKHVVSSSECLQNVHIPLVK